MFREEIQVRIGWLLGTTLLSVSIAVTPITSLDPINLPKMWVLSALSFAICAVLFVQFKVLFQKKHWQFIVYAGLVFLFMMLAMLNSNSVMVQQIFGVYGRNTGLLTYFCFGVIFIASSIAMGKKAFKPVLLGTTIALGINAIYGLVQAVGKDPQKWSNPYAPVIGTLGNPNFVAAFLGMGMAFACSYLVASKVDFKIKILSVLYICIALYDILKSDAQQGFVVSAISFGLVGYFLLKSKYPSLSFRLIYLGAASIATAFAVLGTLQKGPLAAYLYKASVTYRGDYWQAGWKMFIDHPWFGVGLDSYGDYYRATRTLAATIRRGPSTVSNAAHNVFIDIAATAGIFALAAYLIVIAIGFRAAWNISKRSKSFDPFFVSVFVAWIGYLVQSVISINNIALGIWGWALPGILVAIDRLQTSDSKKPEKIQSADFSSMAMVMGLVAGGVIGFFPFNSDANFRHALESGNQDAIYSASLKWPTDAARINYAVRIFDQNNEQTKAVELAREAIKLSPRNFDAWMYLYSQESVSGNEKREILDRLKMLDPINPELAKLG
jgi:O-antigen ligase